MIPATKIELHQPAQTSPAGGRSSRPGDGERVQPVAPTGRALATQRDALLFRTEAMLRHGGPAPAPYLAQQIGQLWPSPPPVIPKSAVHAYLRTEGLPDGADHRGSWIA